VLLALLLSAPAGYANTYQYSFTTTQLLSALSTEVDYSEDGYYSVLLQPTTLSGYSIAAATSPDPADGAADWQANVDNANPFGTGAWIEFGKGNTQTAVTLVSGANGGPGGNNIFYYPGIKTDNTYSDNSQVGQTYGPPIGFGNTVASITNIMSAGDLFSFQLNMATNPGPVTFTGQAYAIWSSGPNGSSVFTPGDGKTREDIQFTLTLAGIQTVPEPGTFILFLAGMLCVLMAVTLRKKMPTTGSLS